MHRLLVTILFFLLVCDETFAQGWTPFIPPPQIPEKGVPFLSDDPAYPKYLEICGEMQENFGSSAEAVKAGRAIMQLQQDFPKSPYPFFALAEYKYMLANGHSTSYAEINAILDRVMRANGNNLPDGYILKAKMAAHDNQAKSALEFANVAVKFAPDKPESQFALARAEQINNHYALAEAAYRKFLTLETSPIRKANIYRWLGDMYSSYNRPRAERDANRAKAKEAYRLGAELGRSFDRIDTYATFLLTDMGDAEAAAPYFTRLLQQDPNNDEVKFYLGLVEYLRWAVANPNGEAIAALDAIQRRSGVQKEDAFAVSAASDGLGVVTSAMLRANAIKNINVVCSASCMDLSSTSAIVNAAQSDNAALVKELVEHGANVNAQGYLRRTPLMYALIAADVDMVAYLLKKGSRVNVAGEDGLTPMAIAVTSLPRSRQLVSILLKYKADPMGIDGSGQPIPFAAVEHENADALNALITLGKVDVNIKNSYGLNLLFYSLGHPDLVRLLLSNGADPWQPAGQGDLLDYARNTVQPGPGMAETIALLEEARKKTPKK